jgi:4-amino-4-deoxy-L-arabinose transferase-like glycosyltransferase
MRALTQAVEKHPQAAFAIFLAVHALVWIALPTLLYPNLPLDLIEALVYGREWQVGYDKLPPLPWWMVEIAYRTVGHDIAYYALAQVAVVAAFALVWITARPIIGAVGALVAVLIVDGLHYFNMTAAKFNHDVVQLPLWALAGYAYRGALREGRIWHWALLGLSIGMALWAKYFVVMLAVPLALFLLIDRDARKALATPGPYVALVVALIVMAPHILWLVANDFLPFAYADARAAPARGVLDHVVQPIVFAAGQIFFLLPALLIALAVVLPRRAPAAAAADPFDRRIVTLLAFGPVATVVALSAFTGRGTVAMWGYPLWLFLGVWIVLVARNALQGGKLTRILLLWGAVAAALAIAFIADYTVLPQYDQRYRAVLFPGERMAQELSSRFRIATGTPLRYVIGSMWDGGNVSAYAPEHPRVLIDGNPRRAPWIDLGDLLNKGAVVVWTDGDPEAIPIAMRGLAGEAQVQPPFDLPFRRGERILSVNWAILRPQPTFASRGATPPL